MALLQRLHKFYRSEARRGNPKMPLENYTTECLVGILEADQGLLRAFAKEVLKIEKSGDETIRIESQKYYGTGTGRRYIDIAIEGNQWLCFIENKVESQERMISGDEGEDQIAAYIEILDQEKERRGIECYMRYCTKWSDPKTETRHDFCQFLWNDVARLLVKDDYKDNHLIQDFIAFLTSQNMAHNMNFQAKDIVSLENMLDNLNRMKQYLEKRIRPLLIGEWVRNFEKQLKEHNRHVLYREGKYNGSGHWDVCIGFVFDAAPGVSITFFVDNQVTNHEAVFKQLREAVEAAKQPKLFKIEPGIYFQYRKPIADFSAEEEMEGAITEWYKEHIPLTVGILNQALPDEKWGALFSNNVTGSFSDGQEVLSKE